MSENNGLILNITAAGREQRANCRLEGLPLPRFSGWVVDTATEQNIDAPIIQTLYSSTQGGETLVERIDPVALGVRILIPADFAGWIRGIGLLTEDGIVYAYCRFAVENNGIYKPIGTAIRQLLILAEDGRDSIEFTYQIVDLAGVEDTLLEKVIRTVFCAGLQSPPFGESFDCDNALQLTDTDVTGIVAPQF